MFIRRTTIKSRKDGSQYYTYRLVESKRTEQGVRQYTLLNLGADFSFPREQWPDLVKRIENILSGQQALFDIDNDIDEIAQDVASKIIASYQDVSDYDDNDYREVDLNSLELNQAVSWQHINGFRNDLLLES
jgi:hypothetical protein